MFDEKLLNEYRLFSNQLNSIFKDSNDTIKKLIFNKNITPLEIYNANWHYKST